MFENLWYFLTSRITYKVRYKNKCVLFRINKTCVKLDGITFSYEQITKFGKGKYTYKFACSDNSEHILYTSKAADVYNKVYARCLKIYNSTIPLAIEIDNPRTQLLTAIVVNV